MNEAIPPWHLVCKLGFSNWNRGGGVYELADSILQTPSSKKAHEGSDERVAIVPRLRRKVFCFSIPG
jgi:hypothetical protein